MTSTFQRLLLAIGCLVLVALPVAAQTSLGTIVGNVLDESGAAIPQVTVTITNEATSAVRTVTSNEAGSYTVPALPPGLYTVAAELKGFRSVVVSHLKLEVNQTLRSDLALKVGEVTERVEVSGVAVQLQTDSSTVATTVDNKKVVELPLNGRSFTQLTVLVPGAVGTGSARFQSSGTTVSISGLRSENNNYTLDAYFATPGYDQAVGLGTVDVDALINNWAKITFKLPLMTCTTPKSIGHTAA